MIKNIFFLFFAVLLVSCGGDKEVEIPEGLIDSNTFTAIMIDVQLTEGMNTQKNYVRNNSSNDQAGADPYTPIFKKHGVNAEEFRRTYDFYSRNPRKMEMIYEQVLDSLNKLDVEIKQKYTQDERAKNDSTRAANQKRSDSIRGIPRPGRN
ncbi:DUF4296 domain-containing protein [Cryomorpha ignava]|uniref:DUF4296 domain-containing protein n=1 Tax=Cryomorpha ignava TaxID=101383 RepID=A0A7K3WV68_9FLAO|nr:DUF4296 domain-containing protein [Cryomorpha ignava]NEN24941.1 DUF4296 domain-containing protein [Cryomorpha ignava]